VFSGFPAFLSRSYGSSKTQNFEDAAANAQSIASLAAAAAQQVPAMRQHGEIAHRLRFLRIL
jgi:hypothetical protein